MQTRSVDSTAPTSVKVAETAFGKSIKISRGKDGRMFQIIVDGGGIKPPVLDGMFTRWTDAENAIKLYVDSGNGRYTAKPDVTVKHPESVLPSTTKRPKIPMGQSFMAPDEPSNADPGDAVAE